MADFHNSFLLMSNVGIEVVLSLKLYSFLHEAMRRRPAVTVMSDTILPGRKPKRSIEIRSRLLNPAFGEYHRLPLGAPSNLDLAGAAPLLCAGITTYSPMRHWGVTKGTKVGVVGLGGLGHMA